MIKNHDDIDYDSLHMVDLSAAMDTMYHAKID